MFIIDSIWFWIIDKPKMSVWPSRIVLWSFSLLGKGKL